MICFWNIVSNGLKLIEYKFFIIIFYFNLFSWFELNLHSHFNDLYEEKRIIFDQSNIKLKYWAVDSYQIRDMKEYSWGRILYYKK